MSIVIPLHLEAIIMITSVNASKTSNQHPDILPTAIATACELLTEVGVGAAVFVV